MGEKNLGKSVGEKKWGYKKNVIKKLKKNGVKKVEKKMVEKKVG